MITTQFTAELEQVFRIAERFEKTEPRAIRWATARMLNDIAFTGRPLAMESINRGMVVRSPGYVRKTIQFGRTSGSLPIRSQESWLGSVAMPGTTGWVEQEFGLKPIQEARHGLASRGGNKRRKVRKEKFRKGKAHTVDDFGGDVESHFSRNQKQQETIMLYVLRRETPRNQATSTQFIMAGGGLMHRGIYSFDSKWNPVWISTIDKAPPTKQYKWLTLTTTKLMTSYPVMKSFRKEYVDQIKKRMR